MRRDAPARGAAVTVAPLMTVRPAPTSEAPYTFTPAFPDGHLVSQIIEYVAGRTDAALEFGEGAA
jgi:hypothetical protein